MRFRTLSKKSGTRPKPVLRNQTPTPTTGLARALSKLGFASRRQAWQLIESGRVQVNGAIQRNPERRVDLLKDRIAVDGQLIRAERKVYLILNKPRGLITTTKDEQGRDTVFECLKTQGPTRAEDGNIQPPRVFPVGRLDKASEGLLLFTNDTAWAAQITAPESHIDKTYHVQIDQLADEAFLTRIRAGVMADGELLRARHVSILRQGEKNSWLEIVLDEGKNRHIRRMLDALNVQVLRLVRVAIGSLLLGTLKKGEFRELSDREVKALSRAPDPKS